MLDSSSSIWKPDFEIQLQFVETVIKNFDVGMGHLETRVGVVTFGQSNWLQFHLNRFDNRKDMMSAVESISYEPGWSTKTGDAINYASGTMFTEENGARSNVTKIMIVITDGESTEKDLTVKAARMAHDMDIHIFAIGVGYQADRSELNAIASKPSAHYAFMVDNYDALSGIQQKFSIRTCEGTSYRVTSKLFVLQSKMLY